MTDKPTIQSYINNFRRYISPFLKPDIGISTIVYPCEKLGAIIEFRLGKDIPSSDEYKAPYSSIAEALNTIPQRAFGGRLAGYHFYGTNYILESNRVLLIKDDSLDQWADDQAQKDVQRVLSVGKKSQ